MFSVLAVVVLPCQWVSAQEDVILGPYVQFAGPEKAIVRWETSVPRDSIVEYGSSPGTLDRETSDAQLTTDHEVVLDNVYLKDKYFYRVGYHDGASREVTAEYWFDNAINYTRVDVSEVASPYGTDSLTQLYESAADRIVAETGITKGYCLVYGCGEGRLAFELAKRTDLIIEGVDTDAAKVDAAANKLMDAGLYGARVTVRHVASYDQLPFTKYFANLIVFDRMISEGATVGSAGEMYRVLRPSGGTAYLGQGSGDLSEAQLRAWLDADGLTYSMSNDSDGVWAKVVRPEVPGSGWWSHQYGGPENNGNANDSLEGGKGTSDMQLQWISWPGADSQVDRMVRMQSPVAKNGRLIHRGFNRLIAMDSYNGAILWSLEITGFQRLNIPRDAGYVCVDDDYVYAAVQDACWRLDGDTGIRSLTHRLQGGGHDWGCVFRYGDKLFGSTVKEGAFHDTWWGHGAWYDATSGDQTYKICSDSIFADDLSGNRVWTYDGADSGKGIIINSTICLGGGRLYFVECRDNAIKALNTGRIGDGRLWNSQYLVALNPETGAKLWDEPINTADGIVVFYMMYANEKLLVASSDTSYHLYAFDAANGIARWDRHFTWSNNNHGNHMDRPVVIGDMVYFQKYGYRISDGQLISSSAPSGSCGIVAGTAEGLLYRVGNIAMWDAATGRNSSWSKIRSSCWLSAIGSGGMVLAPEGGGGCDCYGWFHTSVAFTRIDE